MEAEYGELGRSGKSSGHEPVVDRSVDLVGRDVHEAVDAVPHGGVEQGLGADDVGHHEVGGAEDRAVDVGLGREVHDGVGGADEVVDEPRVEDVALDEGQPGIVADRRQVGEVAGVGELVQDGDVGGLVRRDSRPSASERT